MFGEQEKSYGELEEETKKLVNDATKSQRVYTWAEIAKHNRPRDCWIVIHGRVYDVTKFKYQHPGGEETLVEVGGSDATAAFEDSRHPTIAREIMQKYDIGRCEDGRPPSDRDCCYTCLPIFFGILFLLLIGLYFFGVFDIIATEFNTLNGLNDNNNNNNNNNNKPGDL